MKEAMEILSGNHWTILVADVLDGMRSLPDKSVHCVVTSPPYWGLRDYGFDGQIGREKTPMEFISRLVEVFCEVHRILRDEGVLFVNIGDTYAASGRGGAGNSLQETNRGSMGSVHGQRKAVDGFRPGDLIGIPWRFAFAMQDAGWILRSQITWAKKSPMPESVSGWRFKNGMLVQGSWRPTKSSEDIFMFVKSPKYFCDGDSSKEPASGRCGGSGLSKALPRSKSNEKICGKQHSQIKQAFSIHGVETRNLRSVWHLASESYKGAHFATFPTELVRRCLSAATSRGGCCWNCGSQFAPVIESSRMATRPGRDSKVTKRETAIENSSCPRNPNYPNAVGNRDPQRHTTVTNVLGFKPTCGCTGTIDRPVVLDPFAGSCTTGQVAINMGCKFIGIEANPSYAQLGAVRIVAPWIPVSERKKSRYRKPRKIPKASEN